jgi:hypothetical protein
MRVAPQPHITGSLNFEPSVILQPPKASLRSRLVPASLVLGCALLLSVFTVWIQVDTLGPAHLELGIQIHRHDAVLRGISGDPWQYRILSDYAVEPVLILLKNLGLPHAVAWGFVLFRVFQNVLIFLLAATYYKKLGLNMYVTMIGLSFLAWGMTHSNYNSDLQLNTYSDIIFYLLAAIAILNKEYVWIFLITLLAAFNRETSGVHTLDAAGGRYITQAIG